MQRIVPNLWFDHKAAEAAAFYTDVFPDARIRETIHYPPRVCRTSRRSSRGTSCTWSSRSAATGSSRSTPVPT